MNFNTPNMMQMWHAAGGAFAERTPSMEPTIEEAYAEFMRAKSFRENALVVGFVVGIATFTLFAHASAQGRERAFSFPRRPRSYTTRPTTASQRPRCR